MHLPLFYVTFLTLFLFHATPGHGSPIEDPECEVVTYVETGSPVWIFDSMAATPVPSLGSHGYPVPYSGSGQSDNSNPDLDAGAQTIPRKHGGSQAPASEKTWNDWNVAQPTHQSGDKTMKNPGWGDWGYHGVASGAPDSHQQNYDRHRSESLTFGSMRSHSWTASTSEFESPSSSTSGSLSIGPLSQTTSSSSSTPSSTFSTTSYPPSFSTTSSPFTLSTSSSTITSNYFSTQQTDGTTTSADSLTTGAATPETAVEGYIMIDDQTDSIRRRSIRYLGFSNNTGVAVDDLDRAALLSFFNDGSVKFGTMFVVAQNVGNYTILALMATKPSVMSTWITNQDKTIVIVGTIGYCIRPDDVLNIRLSTFDSPPNCTIVTLLRNDRSSISSTTSSTITSSLSTTSSSSFSSITSFTNSSTTATITTTTTSTACAATDTTMLNAPNPFIDPSLLTNLFVSRSTTLVYVDPPPGNDAISIAITTIYDQITLENSALIDQVTCTANTVSVTATDSLTYFFVRGWPTSNFILITNSAGCNAQTQRGVYLVSGSTADSTSNTVTFTVTPQEWSDVAETMTISFGTYTTANDEDQLDLSSSCTNSVNPAPSTTTTSDIPDRTPLSPGAQAMLDYIVSLPSVSWDNNGNMIVTTQPDPIVLDGGDIPIDDPATQAALEDMLQKDGLPDPDTMFDQARNGTDPSRSSSTGPPLICPAAPRGPPRRLARSVPVGELVDYYDYHQMSKRLSAEDILDYICSDWAEIFCAPFEQVNEIREFICALNEAVQAARDMYALIKCMINPFCFNPPTVTITITYPPATQWKYTYGWSASWSGLNNYRIVSQDAGNYIKCTDCSFSITNFQIDGQITYNVTARTVTEAHNTVSFSGEAHLVMDMETTGSFSRSGTAFNSNLDLGNKVIDSMFSFWPTIIYSLGAEGVTNAPVTGVTGGAVLQWNGATAYLDYLSKTTTNYRNWKPSIQMTYPGFRDSAQVSLRPIMRTDMRITMNILKGVLSSTSAITEQLTIGFDAAFSETATSSCAANMLQLTSYVKSQSNSKFGTDTLPAPVKLDDSTSSNPAKCFNVPQIFPNSQEIAALAAVGGEFCTSFIGYVAPVTYLVTRATSTTVSVTTTETVSTTPVIQTSTVSLTTTVPVVWTYHHTSVAYTTVGGGVDSLEATYIKRSLPTPAQAINEGLLRRAVATPTMVTTWASDKISYACSQIATGTATSTVYTATDIVYSSTSTTTTTRFVGSAGPPVTTTITTTLYPATSILTSEVATTTSTATTGCPVQTQVACFKVKGHGTPFIENQYLGIGRCNPNHMAVFGGNPVDGIFHLSQEGHLVSLPDRRVLYGYSTTSTDFFGNGPYADGDIEPGAAQFFTLTQFNSLSGLQLNKPGTIMAPAICQTDCDTMTLTCTNSDGVTQAETANLLGSSSFGFSNSANYWASNGDSSPCSSEVARRLGWTNHANQGYVWASTSKSPIWMEFEPVTCPCGS